LASLIASAIALEALLTFPEDAIDTRSNQEVAGGLTERDLQFNSQAGAGTGIAVSVLLMFLGIAVIIVRFLNFGLVNAKSKIFLSIVSEYCTCTCVHILTFEYTHRYTTSYNMLVSNVVHIVTDSHTTDYGIVYVR
jgi:hypothetical protein